MRLDRESYRCQDAGTDRYGSYVAVLLEHSHVTLVPLRAALGFKRCSLRTALGLLCRGFPSPIFPMCFTEDAHRKGRVS